jgi:hypothetical protein
MWWMQKAIIDLHQSPYFTTYLHYPYGTTLVAQTLHPFNGLVSLFLPFLSVGQAYNVMVVAGFALGGWTAFLLCRKVSGSYWSSLVGGAVFTFSSYHFAHAEGALAEEEALDLGAARLAEAAARDIPSEALRSKDRKTIIPSLHGALLKNEQDVHLFERLVFMTRAKGA